MEFDALCLVTIVIQGKTKTHVSNESGKCKHLFFAGTSAKRVFFATLEAHIDLLRGQLLFKSKPDLS